MAVRPLSKELAEKARLELNEDPNRIASDLQHMKDWLTKQPHLKVRTDDQWLVAFLRGSKYSLERAKQKFDLYYSVRTTAPELFRVKHTDPLFNEILESGPLVILPKTQSPDAPRVELIRPGAYDANKFQTSDVMSVMNLLQQIQLIEDDNTVVAGTLTLLDLEGVTMSHFMHMTPSLIKKMTVITQLTDDANRATVTDLSNENEITSIDDDNADAAPLRMKGVHYINTPPGFETLFNAIKSLLNEKNKQRLYVHNKNYEEMYKYIPKDILPAEYGGNAGTINEIIDSWKKKVEQYNEWLLEEMQHGTDESKRPGKPKTAEDMFGLEGSFRQLQFD